MWASQACGASEVIAKASLNAEMEGSSVTGVSNCGANITLMVEMLVAGLAGNNCLSVDYSKHLAEKLDRLETEYSIYIETALRAEEYSWSLNEGIKFDKPTC